MNSSSAALFVELFGFLGFGALGFGDRIRRVRESFGHGDCHDEVSELKHQNC
jgi:hypothetical protein